MAAAPPAVADMVIGELGARGRAAARIVARAATSRKAEAIRASAAALRVRANLLLAANAEDVASAEEAGASGAMLDRLTLTPARIAGMAAALETVAALPDPVGAQIDQSVRPNGLVLERVRIPLGLVGIIYESRPNVTADAGALCLMAGNAVMLRGGSDAARSSATIHACLIEGLRVVNLPEDAVQLVPSSDRALVGAMLRASGLIDVIVPRGGKGLVARVQAEARVPVLAHLDGMNTTYVHAAADPTKTERVVLDAKLRRTGVCGATETLLIDRAYPASARLIAALINAGCEVRGTPEVQALDARVAPAGQADWTTEYLDSILSVALVDGADEAMAHIAAHGSGHTDAILTEDSAMAARFLAEVDSAIVIHNASTQFADGGEFGLGGEIGIATGRLHARGPVALEGLTTYKWLVRGSGQARG